MNWQRIALLGVLGGTLVALIARAATPVPPPAASLSPTLLPPAPAVPTAAMFAEIDKLRSRLRAPIQPAAPTRNLFAFRPRVSSTVRPARVARATAPEPIVAVPPPARRPPAYTLIGLAEDTGPDGPIRTAILSGGSGVIFAKVGDQVGEYRVTAIAADALQLTAADDPTPQVLTLK